MGKPLILDHGWNRQVEGATGYLYYLGMADFYQNTLILGYLLRALTENGRVWSRQTWTNDWLSLRRVHFISQSDCPQFIEIPPPEPARCLAELSGRTGSIYGLGRRSIRSSLPLRVL